MLYALVCKRRKDKRLYRIHWLEVRIRDIHELILVEGRRKFNRVAQPATEEAEGTEEVVFNFSWWFTAKVRPFFVKDGGRDVCVCVYHLRWDVFVETLFNYVKRLRSDLKICNCQHTNYKDPVDFRRAYTCARQETCERYDKVECVTNLCSTCKDLALLKVCECTVHDQLPPIKCQVWEKIDCTHRCPPRSTNIH